MAELAALLDTVNGGPAFEQLVATLTSADNVQRGAAEKVYEQCKEHPPQCTQQLTRVLRTSANTQARGLAAVLLRKVRQCWSTARATVRSSGPCRHWRPRVNRMRAGMTTSPCVATSHQTPFRNRLLAAAVRRERELPPTGACAACALHTLLPQGASWMELHESAPVVRWCRWGLHAAARQGLQGFQSLRDARKIQPTALPRL